MKQAMASVTPRRSNRVSHNHTPKMSDRKKGLFPGAQAELNDSLTKHRRLPIVESESDSEECDLVMGALDSSSGDENDQGIMKTPERVVWKETRSHTKKLIKQTQHLKNFMKSPFTLNKYQTRYSGPEKSGSSSTPATPHVQNHPGTPSSSHSCASVHSVSTTSSKARKSLANLIADTESCSSSLKDLNFDTDSGTDSKENTPKSSVRRSSRRKIMTPKFKSFKGVLLERKKNGSPTPMVTSPMKSTLPMSKPYISPTQLLKTPHNNNETCSSPPKISHNRRSAVEIQESPESSIDETDSQVQKRLRNDSLTDSASNAKYPKLDSNQPAPKARLSLFNSDKLKEILSAKSFYGKSNPDLNSSITSKINSAIDITNSQRRRSFPQAHSQKRKRKPGQINMGVKHRIKKPKFYNNKMDPRAKSSLNKSSHEKALDSSCSNESMNNSSLFSHNVSQDVEDKADPFDNEKQTIESLLSQWTEEEIPESELVYNNKKPELACFNKTVIEETSQIFQPVSAIPVVHVENMTNEETVIVELGATNIKSQGNANLTGNFAILDEQLKEHDVMMTDADEHLNSHGEKPVGDNYLPVEGGYILVGSNPGSVQEELPDLDEIEREMRLLDEQILRMAQSNNIDADIVIASTETVVPDTDLTSATATGTEVSMKETDSPKPHKVFPIFTNPNPGTNATPKVSSKTSKKAILKTGTDQYVIDAGQKKFGATQCPECNVIYQIGDPQDEHDHLVHHNATDVLKFQGWKEETLVGLWNEGTERCIRVRGGDPGWKKIETLLFRVIHPSLGYADTLPRDSKTYTAYLYIDKKQIVGCLIMEPKTKAYKLIPGEPDCCSIEEYPVLCGISRIWTHANYRRRGIAHRMLDCARASFLYGAAVRKADIAFSAPTAPGKALAAKYCGTQNFLIYLD